MKRMNTRKLKSPSRELESLLTTHTKEVEGNLQAQFEICNKGILLELV